MNRCAGFFLKEYKGYTFGIRAMIKLPIQNKVGAFVTNPLLQPILGQPKSSFDLRQIMDEGKILLVNLAKGKIGQDVAFLLGALLTTKIGLAALGRADVPEEERRDFFLYADEASSYTSLAFANALAELRKYRLGIVAAGQTLSQLDPEIRAGIAILATRLAISPGFPFWPWHGHSIHPRRPECPSFRAEPCTSAPPVGARARPSAHRR